eukprot:scaffold25095_cov55-Phaeocystis_antarctica.AAC.4
MQNSNAGTANVRPCVHRAVNELGPQGPAGGQPRKVGRTKAGSGPDLHPKCIKQHAESAPRLNGAIFLRSLPDHPSPQHCTAAACAAHNARSSLAYGTGLAAAQCRLSIIPARRQTLVLLGDRP